MPTDMMRSERGPSGPALLIQQLLGLWERQSRGRRLVAVVALGAVAAAIGWGALFERTERWKVVVTAHHDEEVHECLAALQRQGIAVRANGRDIEVSPGDMMQARQALEAAGLPDAGVGPSRFDDIGVWSSAFAEQVSYTRALQDELVRSIKGLAPVNGARVHLSMGKPSLFRDRDAGPSASVMLWMRPGPPLSAAQVRGIQQLVTGSVQGLRAEDVSVIDQVGNVLGESSLAGGGQAELEQAVAGKVRGILERVVGADKVVVVVSADMDLRRVEETAEIFDGARVGGTVGAGMVGSAGKAEGTASAVAPEVGPAAPAASAVASTVAAVAPTASAAAPASTAAPVSAVATAGERRASPSHVVTATRFPGARLARMHLAVVVDYGRGADGTKVAPTSAQLEQWRLLASSAAGLDEARGDRLEMQAAPLSPIRPESGHFAPAAALSREEVPRWAMGAGAVGLLAIAVASASLARRSLRRQLEERERRAEALSQELLASERRTAEAQAALRTAHVDPGRRPAADRVNDIVRRDLDSAALVLAAWLGDAEREVERPVGVEGRLS